MGTLSSAYPDMHEENQRRSLNLVFFRLGGVWLVLAMVFGYPGAILLDSTKPVGIVLICLALLPFSVSIRRGVQAFRIYPHVNGGWKRPR